MELILLLVLGGGFLLFIFKDSTGEGCGVLGCMFAIVIAVVLMLVLGLVIGVMAPL